MSSGFRSTRVCWAGSAGGRGEDAAAGINVGAIAWGIPGVVVAGWATSSRVVDLLGGDGRLGGGAGGDARLAWASPCVADDVCAVSCHQIAILHGQGIAFSTSSAVHMKCTTNTSSDIEL